MLGDIPLGRRFVADRLPRLGESWAHGKRMSELEASRVIFLIRDVAKDGEQAWRIHPQHATAKRCAIESLFAEYKFQIGNVLRGRSWLATTTHESFMTITIE